jgi:hypothetical protein
MFILQQNKHTNHELNQRISKIHKLIWGCLPPWVLACAGKWRWLGKGVGRAREAGRDPRRRAGSGEASSGELRRAGRVVASSGDDCKRGELERERQFWVGEEVRARRQIYREQEGEGKGRSIERE